MKSEKMSRKFSIHLYNQKKEGIGTYDINYINAYKKRKVIKKPQNQNDRYAA
tara:strand:- start:405 stop:560 length:156 start_codon:yes stop_codon:yes gene_type:complete